MATHTSVLAWRIPGTGNLVGFHLWGHPESDTTEATWQQLQGGNRTLLYHCVIAGCLFPVPAFLCSLKRVDYWDLFKVKHRDQA